jgi:hypothetical protein
LRKETGNEIGIRVDYGVMRKSHKYGGKRNWQKKVCKKEAKKKI